MTVFRNSLPCTCAIVLLAVAAEVRAVPVRVAFTGSVSQVTQDATAFFNAGDLMTGAFVYDSLGPIVTPPRDQTINYLEYAPFVFPNHGFVAIGAYTAKLTSEAHVNVGGNSSLFMENNQFGGIWTRDAFTANPLADGPTLGAMKPNHLNFHLSDETASAFDSVELPLTLPPISNFQFASWTFLFESTAPNNLTYAGTVSGTITSYETAIVPEPTTSILLPAIVLFHFYRRANRVLVAPRQ